MTNKPIFLVVPALLAIVIGSAAAAQQLPPGGLPSEADISRLRVAPPTLPPPSYDFRIQNAQRSAVPLAVDELKFTVARIDVEGAAHLPDETVRALVAPLEGRTILLQDLWNVAAALEDRYRQAGFFLTRVFVPPQQVADGILRLQVIEGYIGEANVTAPDEGSRKTVEALIRPVLAQRPASFPLLDSRLLILNDIPGLAVTSVLTPGMAPGSSLIEVSASREPDSFYAHVDNYSSDILGPVSYSLGGTLARPLGLPGALSANYLTAGERFAELHVGTLRYSFPIGATGLIGSVGGLAAFASPGGAVADLEVDSRIINADARLRWPLWRRRQDSLYLDIALTLKRSRTLILGERVVDDRSTVGEVTLNWQRSGLLGGDLSASVGLFRGLALLGANAADAPLSSAVGFNPRFTRILYTVQRIQTFTDRLSATFAVQGQYSSDRLVAPELVAFGGPGFGRGYDPSVITGERGIAGSAELRWAFPGLGVTGRLDGLQAYGFGDIGRATIIAKADEDASPQSLASLGAGVRFTLFGRAAVDLQVADPRKPIAGLDPGTRYTFNLTFVF